MPSELLQMQLDMNDMKNDIKTVTRKQDEMSDKVDEIHSDLKDFIEKSGHLFASKWVERIMIFIGSAVVLAIIAAFMALVLKHPTPYAVQ